MTGTASDGWGGPTAGGYDCAVVKIDSDGNVLWEWQVIRRSTCIVVVTTSGGIELYACFL